MNARLPIRSHANPWDLPHEFVRVAPEDHFRDAHAEEAVLSHMLWKNKQSTRLTVEHFTSPDRRAIFEAIQEGAPYETIERLDLEMPGYACDLFFAPANAPVYLREAVETLERLAELRRLRDRVKDWERRAPTLSVQRARAELAAVLKEAM